MLSKRRNKAAVSCAAMLAVALASLGLAGSASAKLTGDFTRFSACPWKTAGVDRCAYAVTDGGEVTLGSKTVPIVNPVTLQGGYTEPIEEGPEIGFSKFVGATNGITLSKTPQPVPGGLLGLVPPASSPPLVKALVELAAENGLTGVNSTLELARPASEIRINESHLAEGLGVALILPLKARLENPLLGSSCYVGSSTEPLIWELRTDATAPPPPNESISGNAGLINFLEGGKIIEVEGAVLVDNAWAAPAAKGCGGALLSALIDPVINAVAGLPAAAGHNTAILENTISATTAFSMKRNDEENP
jgi:hypothetical protein